MNNYDKFRIRFVYNKEFDIIDLIWLRKGYDTEWCHEECIGHYFYLTSEKYNNEHWIYLSETWYEDDFSSFGY